MFSPGVKRMGLHLDEGNVMIMAALYETCKFMWPRADGFGMRLSISGTVLEEVVLSMEAEYAYLHPDVLGRTVQHLNLLLSGDRCGYGPEPGSEDGGANTVGEDESSVRMWAHIIRCSDLLYLEQALAGST